RGLALRQRLGRAPELLGQRLDHAFGLRDAHIRLPLPRPQPAFPFGHRAPPMGKSSLTPTTIILEEPVTAMKIRRPAPVAASAARGPLTAHPRCSTVAARRVSGMPEEEAA